MSDKDCMSCPSFANRTELGNLLGIPVDFDGCKRHGIVLSNDRLSSTATVSIRRKTALHCDEHGVAYDAAPVLPVVPVAKASTKMLDYVPQQPDAFVQSCTGCKFYQGPSATQEQFGWHHGMCTVKGALIVDAPAQAKGCDLKSARLAGGFPDSADMKIIEMYREPTPAELLKRSSENILGWETIITDPDSFTIRPVTQKQRDVGIVAWREMTDPKTGDTVPYPVFNPEHFPVEHRNRVPKAGEGGNPELYVDHLGLAYSFLSCTLELDMTYALIGEPGTGKTQFFEYLGWLMGLPFYRITVTPKSEPDDLVDGKWTVIDGNTEFQLAKLAQIWDIPCIIDVDEPNMNPDVLARMRPIMDDARQLVLDVWDGRKKDRGDFTFLGLAFNPAWDFRNSGTQELSDADGRRIVAEWVTLPPPDIEKEILRSYCKVDGYDIEDAKLDTLMTIAIDLREMSANGTIPVSWGLAQQIKVARLTRRFGYERAFKLAVTNRLDQREGGPAEAILSTVNSLTGASR